MTNMATKKKAKGTSKKGGGTKFIIGDPPILVGGGGSAYLWVDLTQDQRPVNPSLDNATIGIKPGAPKPNTRANYACSRVTKAPTTITIYTGAGAEQSFTIVDAKTWFMKVE
jgi:hypothetical protein